MRIIHSRNKNEIIKSIEYNKINDSIELIIAIKHSKSQAMLSTYLAAQRDCSSPALSNNYKPCARGPEGPSWFIHCKHVRQVGWCKLIRYFKQAITEFFGHLWAAEQKL